MLEPLCRSCVEITAACCSRHCKQKMTCNRWDMPCGELYKPKHLPLGTLPALKYLNTGLVPMCTQMYFRVPTHHSVGITHVKSFPAVKIKQALPCPAKAAGHFEAILFQFPYSRKLSRKHGLIHTEGPFPAAPSVLLLTKTEQRFN